MRPFRTMRGRTTIVAVLVTALALIAVGVTLVNVLRDSLIDEVDRSLRARLAFINAQLDDPRGSGVVTESVRRSGLGNDTLELLIGPGGKIQAGSDRSGDARREILERLPDEEVPFTADLGSFKRTEGSDNMRVLAVIDEPTIPTLGRIVTATSLDDVDETVASVRRVLLIAGPLLVGLVGIGVWTLVGRALKPVGEAQREADQISGSDLSRRLQMPGSRDEIADLTATINAMLDRLEDAQREQRRFVADASHELRSPLAGISAQLDVSLLHPERTEWEPIARNLREETERLQHMLDDLLLMARWEGSDDGRPGRQLLVDLDDVVLEEARAMGAQRPEAIDARAVSSGVVSGDPDELRRLVRNLLSNALRHAASRIALALTERDGEVVLTVDDDGPGIPRRDRGRVFDRFTRLDPGRGAGAGGSGLGLAICREIAERHGGSISIEEAPEPLGGARLIVALPAAEAVEAAPGDGRTGDS